MAKGSVWISPNENKVITPKSPIDNAHPNPIQKDTTGKILGNIIILNRLNPVILKLSDNFPTSDETLFIAGNKARKIKGNDIVAFIKITKIGVNISRFINGLNKSKIKLDRKVLADLAYNNPEAFKSLVKKVQLSVK